MWPPFSFPLHLLLASGVSGPLVVALPGEPQRFNNGPFRTTGSLTLPGGAFVFQLSDRTDFSAIPEKRGTVRWNARESGYGSRTQLTESPENPGRFIESSGRYGELASRFFLSTHPSRHGVRDLSRLS